MQKGKYKHLTNTEREEISRCLAKKQPFAEIARQLGRATSTKSLEKYIGIAGKLDIGPLGLGNEHKSQHPQDGPERVKQQRIKGCGTILLSLEFN